jgi:hypothetical protein
MSWRHQRNQGGREVQATTRTWLFESSGCFSVKSRCNYGISLGVDYSGTWTHWEEVCESVKVELENFFIHQSFVECLVRTQEAL